jgi:hypothetical protein
MTEAVVFVRKSAISRENVHKEDKVDVRKQNLRMVPEGE